MNAKVNVKPWRTCSNNTECTAMSPETHTIQTTHFHRMIHYQRIRSQRWLVPRPGLPQDASRASEGPEDISTIYTPWPKFGQISGSGDYIYTFITSSITYITIPVRRKQKYTWSHEEHAAITQKARRCPQRCIMRSLPCVDFPNWNKQVQVAPTGLWFITRSTMARNPTTPVSTPLPS